MTKTIRLTMAQALARFLTRQMTEIDGKKLPLFAGVWAIFGHGNVAGLGEALYGVRDELPTYRAHNEQAMAHTRGCLCQGDAAPADDGLHVIDRTWRAQHGDGGRSRACRPPTGLDPARRHLRQSQA